MNDLKKLSFYKYNACFIFKFGFTLDVKQDKTLIKLFNIQEDKNSFEPVDMPTINIDMDSYRLNVNLFLFVRIR